MTIFVRKNIYHLLDRYDILDDSGQLIYTADGLLTRLNGRLILRDKLGIEVLRLRKSANPLFSKYRITTFEDPDEPLAEIRQCFTFRPRFHIVISGEPYELRGNLRASNFELTYGGTLCARVLKRVMSWGDTYVVTLSDPDNAPIYGAIAAALDNALYPRH